MVKRTYILEEHKPGEEGHVLNQNQEMMETTGERRELKVLRGM